MKFEDRQKIVSSISLKQIIIDTIKRERFQGDKSATLHPSSSSVELKGKYLDKLVVGGCLRKQYWDIKNTPEPWYPSVYLLLTMMLGNAVEDATVKMFHDSGRLRAPTMLSGQPAMINTDLNIKGLMDAVMRGELGDISLLPGETTDIITEIKSFFGYYAKRKFEGFRHSFYPYLSNDQEHLLLQNKAQKDLTKEEKKLLAFNKTVRYCTGFPREHQLFQLVSYLHHFYKTVPGGKFLYMGRDNPEIFEFDVVLKDLKHNPNHQAIVVNGKEVKWCTTIDIYRRYGKLKSYVDNNEVPPADYKRWYSFEDVKKRWLEQHVAGTNYHPFTSLVTKKHFSDALVREKQGELHAGFGDFYCEGCQYEDRCQKYSKTQRLSETSTESSGSIKGCSK